MPPFLLNCAIFSQMDIIYSTLTRICKNYSIDALEAHKVLCANGLKAGKHPTELALSDNWCAIDNTNTFYLWDMERASRLIEAAGHRLNRRAAKKILDSASSIKSFGDPSENTWVAYTDGAADISTNRFGWGLVLLSPSGEIFKYSGKGIGRQTNNRMELMGILAAVENTPIGCKLSVFTDSNYCLQVVNKAKPKANADLIKDIQIALLDRNIEIKLFWVKGHAKFKYNEMADELAAIAMG